MLGEFIAWIVGWGLVLEYAIGAAVVSVGWSGYMNGLLAHSDLFGMVQPGALALPEFLRSSSSPALQFMQKWYLVGFGVALVALMVWLPGGLLSLADRRAHKAMQP